MEKHKTSWQIDDSVTLRLALVFVVSFFFISETTWVTQFSTDSGVKYLLADDSMITLRVARNFSNNLGLVYNQSESVAATTSLAWPVLISPVFHLFGLSQAVLVCFMSSLFISFLIIMTLGFTALGPGSLLLAGGMLVLCSPLRAYGGTAWEHVPQALCVTLAFAAILGRLRLKPCWRLGVSLFFLACAFALRPDALPLIAVVGAVALHDATARSNWRSAAMLGLSGATIVAYFGIHYAIYGEFVPNTFFLKVGFGIPALVQGARYVATSALQSVVPVCVGILSLHVLWDRRPAQPGRGVVVAALAAQTAYIVAIGGDVFAHGRFFLLIAPITFMLTAELLIQMSHDKKADKRWSWAAAFIGLFSLCSIYTYNREKYQFASQYYGTRESNRSGDPVASQVALGDEIRKKLKPEDGQIGLFYLGSLGYYLPEYQMADFLGKADPAIAHGPFRWGPPGHSKWNIDVTLRSRNVAVVPLMPPDSPEEAATIVRERRPFAFWWDLQISPLIASGYTYLRAEDLGQNHRWGMYVRNDLAGRWAK